MSTHQHQRINKQADHLLAHYRKIGSPAILAAVRHLSARQHVSHRTHSHYNQKALAMILSRNA